MLHFGPLISSDQLAVNDVGCVDRQQKLRQILLRVPLQKKIAHWPRRLRCSPNPFLRSSLFSVRNKNKKRKQLNDVDLITIGTHKITYTGEELRQDDHEVYLQVMHYCRKLPVSNSDTQPTCTFSVKTMCTDLGWPTSGHYYNKVELTLKRLQNTQLTIFTKKYQTSVSLLRKIKKNIGYKTTYDVYLEHEIVDLFERNVTTGLNHNKHQLLSPLAKWLNGYLSSHAEPFPILTMTLMNATGCNYTRLRDFNGQLNKALKELLNLQLIESFDIEKSKLTVIR